MAATIAVFAKEPVPWTVKTRLAPPLDGMQSARLAGALIKDTVDMINSMDEFKNKVLYYYPSSGAGYFGKIAGHKWDIKLQEGKGLKERMSAAFGSIIKKNGPPAVIIGTDLPGLPISFLQASIRVLKRDDIVIGPSRDGGFYLIGVSGYFPQLFEKIRWSTSNAFGDLVNNINSLDLSFHVLPEWFDIDDMDGLCFFIKKMKDIDKRFYRRIRRLVSKELLPSSVFGQKNKN